MEPALTQLLTGISDPTYCCQVKISSERHILATQIKKNIKTIYLNDSKKYFRKLDNKTLRLKIPGEDNVTAKDIWLDGLTSQEDWLLTTKNIADRWGIALKTARLKMTLLSNAGLVEHEKIVDPKTNKILMHIWFFHEKPLPPKEGAVAPYDGTSKNKNKIEPKKAEKPLPPKEGVVVPIIEKEQRKKEQQPPEDDPAVCSVVDFLHNYLKPEYRNSLKKDLIKEAIEKHHRTKPQLEKLIEQINRVRDLKSAGAYFRNVAFNLDNDLPEDQQPVVIDVREKAKKDQEKYEESLDYEPISQEEMKRMTDERRQKADIKKRQSLNKSISDQNTPFNPPKKDLVIKEEISIDKL